MNTNHYVNQRSWSDQFTPQLISILYNIKPFPLAVTIADHKADCEEATDLFVDSIDRIYRVGLRVRKPEFKQFKDQFTIRTSTGKTGVSEFDKIAKPDGPKFMLYGWTDRIDGVDKLTDWKLFDLDVWRLAHASRFCDVFKDRRDGPRADFMAFGWSTFDDYGRIVAASSDDYRLN